MEYLLKKKREKIEADAERLFGNDIVVKTAYVLSQMKASEEEIRETIEYMRKENEDLVAEIEAKMIYRFDASGNVVPIKDDGIEIKISD
jgi:cyanate lyase